MKKRGNLLHCSLLLWALIANKLHNWIEITLHLTSVTTPLFMLPKRGCGMHTTSAGKPGQSWYDTWVSYRCSVECEVPSWMDWTVASYCNQYWRAQILNPNLYYSYPQRTALNKVKQYLCYGKHYWQESASWRAGCPILCFLAAQGGSFTWLWLEGAISADSPWKKFCW